MMEMKIISKKATDLIPAEYNPRQITDEQMQQLKKSLENFDCVEPLVINAHPDRMNVVIGGHQRLKAMLALGWDLIPCVEVVLPLEREKELNVRLNKNVGAFDFELLAMHYDMADLLEWGFKETEFNFMMPKDNAGLCDEDEVSAPPERPFTILGDIWLLGDHRLMCGDSTVITDMEKLINGHKADMIFTDPPYGMSYGGGRASGSTKKGALVKAHGMILGDDLRADDLTKMIADSINCAKINTKEGAAVYVCFPWRTYSEFEKALIGINLKPSACIVWDKKSIGLGNANYRPQHEFIFYIKGGAWYGDKSQSDVWAMSRGATGEYVHPTQKPVELIERAIVNSSKQGDYILDCFGGSGSTMIACEKKGRINATMELDPKYVDVIIKRWQKYTGKQAIHAGTNRPFGEAQLPADSI